MGTPRREDGFTLVELMVVVLIIGILVAIAIPVFNSVSNTARGRTCQSNQRLIEGAAQQYIAATGSLWGHAHRFNGNGSADTVDMLVPNYIKVAPKCPKSGLYFYVDEHGTVTGDTDTHAWTAGHGHF
ncbi:MAG: hypothetical protein FD171_1031 [Actinobacteria bacterium]|nr:MAG: hypothetical protein FD171_1031 [Actinomycetota bacterium]MDO8950517.1 type II secretion system protein [Actinomycetota bacterium]